MGARRLTSRSDLGSFYDVSPDDNLVYIPESQMVISHDNDVMGRVIVGGLFGPGPDSAQSTLYRMAIFMVLLLLICSGDNRGK